MIFKASYLTIFNYQNGCVATNYKAAYMSDVVIMPR